MSRLRRFDKGLILVVVSVWALCFGLSLKSTIRGTALSLVQVEAPSSPQGYPTVIGMSPLYAGGAAALEAGDRLIRLGDADLRGIGAIAIQGILAEQADEHRVASLVFERGGETRETVFPAGSCRIFWPWLLVSLTWMGTALTVLLRAPESPVARAVARAGLCAAVIWATAFGVDVREQFLSVAVMIPSYSMAFPLAAFAVRIFPHGEAPSKPWSRIWPWLFAIYGPLFVIGNYGFLVAPTGSFLAALAVAILFNVVSFVIAIRNYRRVDAVMRRQMKWVVLGLYFTVLPSIAFVLLLVLGNEYSELWLNSFAVHALLPISLLIGIARYNFFDIDRLISATASYNLLAISAVGAALIIVPRLSGGVSQLLGLDPANGQLLLAAPLAIAVVLGHRRLRPQIEKWFFRERHAVDVGVEHLIQDLVCCGGATELTRALGEGVHRLLRPETCVVYSGGPQGYAPVFVEGRGVPPAFEAEGPLIVALRGRDTPLVLDEAGRRSDRLVLGPMEKAALQAIGAAVVLPIGRGNDLPAFLCLGRKQSGDVYTPADLGLLAAVASTVSTELLRRDDAEVIRQEKAMLASLRRYVPGAVAEQLASGEELISGEAEVSVLFVDIRGYTGFAETRRAAEIFSAVNRYTESVSEIVGHHGGAVVEFNGDGMMTVFGAPRTLENKERAAVAAGREILAAVSELPLADLGGAEDGRETGPKTLSVGVGIATGEAFVGNIRAADRMIWTAIGNTTNLAARLQTLSRDLDAGMIDTPTRDALGPDGSDFESRPGVEIRGRREHQDLHVLRHRGARSAAQD